MCCCPPHVMNEQSRWEEVGLPEVTHGLQGLCPEASSYHHSGWPCTYFILQVCDENPTRCPWKVYWVESHGPVSPTLCPTWHSAPHQHLPHLLGLTHRFQCFEQSPGLFSLKQTKTRLKPKTLFISVVPTMTEMGPPGHLVSAMDQCPSKPREGF